VVIGGQLKKLKRSMRSLNSLREEGSISLPAPGTCVREGVFTAEDTASDGS